MFAKNNPDSLDGYSIDLSKYGIDKPIKSVNRETIEGNYETLDWGLIPMIKDGTVQVYYHSYNWFFFCFCFCIFFFLPFFLPCPNASNKTRKQNRVG